VSGTEAGNGGGGFGRRFLLLIPLAVFVLLAAIFLLRLETGGDVSATPSALIGKPAPSFDLPALEGTGVPGLKRDDLLGHVTLVNVFGSWCGPCRLEHRQLTALAADKRFRLVGIDYKDRPENARRFLEELGNPYAAIGVDARGRSAIDWGVYGVPETFLVGPDGTIIRKFIGPILPENLDEVKAAIDAAGAS
jgi:cytochrome c biogenesis protein CcmG/thiol:disulfide interchange protein DsbE